MRQILTHEDLIKYAPVEYARLKNAFGEDYDLMNKTNDMSIRLKDVESRFTKLRYKLGNKIMGITHDLLEIEIKFERWDSKNKKWKLIRIIPGQSYTEALSEMWYMNMAGQAGINILDVNNVERAWAPNSSGIDTIQDGWMNCWALRADTAAGTTSQLFGILIGTGSGAVGLTNFDLETQLTTNWIYAIMTLVSDTTINGQSLEISISRLFRNTTGSQVTVEEVGLAGVGEYSALSQDDSIFLWERSLSGGFVVETAETMRVTYTLKVTAA